MLLPLKVFNDTAFFHLHVIKLQFKILCNDILNSTQLSKVCNLFTVLIHFRFSFPFGVFYIGFDSDISKTKKVNGLFYGHFFFSLMKRTVILKNIQTSKVNQIFTNVRALNACEDVGPSNYCDKLDQERLS